jgi:hypothetical protein
MSAKPKYVIINDCDAPQPSMVCSWVPGIGYCYLDRRGSKPDHDGMQGAEATPIEAFGFAWAEDPDEWVRFYLDERPSTATYRDGQPRRWQSPLKSFEWRQLNPAAVQRRP